MTKPCIECGVQKPLSEYYAHPGMADGHLGVCKECHKWRMKMRRLTNPAVQEYENARSKQPARRKLTAENRKKWRAENPEGYRAHSAVSYALRAGKLKKLPCELCGANRHVHAHHSDYSKPLDVNWLCAKCHNRIHAMFPELHGRKGEAA